MMPDQTYFSVSYSRNCRSKNNQSKIYKKYILFFKFKYLGNFFSVTFINHYMFYAETNSVIYYNVPFTLHYKIMKVNCKIKVLNKIVNIIQNKSFHVTFKTSW